MSAQRSSAMFEHAPRFLLVRLDGLGDALACIPMLEGLRRAHPQARFSAVCSPANATIFSARVSPVHVIEPSDRASDLHDAMAAQRYTHAIVATEEVSGYDIARACGASRRSGFWHGFEKPLKSLWQFSQLTDRIYRPARWTAQPKHEVETLYRLATPFGAAEPAPSDPSSLRAWLAIESSPGSPTQTIGFQITRKLTSDGWGPSALASAFATAFTESGLSAAVLLAGADDQGLARSILEHLPSGMRDRTQLLAAGSVPQWFGAIARLSVLVTPDTGAAHAAGMLGVPVVDIFEEARFEQLSRQWRPWASSCRCLMKPAWIGQDGREFGTLIGGAARALLAPGVLA